MRPLRAVAAAVVLAFPFTSAARAAKAELDRSLGGVSLGATEKALRGVYKLKDASKGAEDPLLPGERLWSLAPVTGGAKRLLVRTRGGKVWAILVDFPAEHAGQSWGEILNAPSERYGTPRHSDQLLASASEQRAEWSDERTRLVYARRNSTDGSADSARLEDLELRNAVTLQALEKATPPPPQACPTFEACLKSGIKLYEAGECREALKEWARAREIWPGDAHSYYFSSVALKLLGDDEGSKREFGRAELLDPELKNRGDGEGGPLVQPDRRCKDAPHAKPAAKN